MPHLVCFPGTGDPLGSLRAATVLEEAGMGVGFDVDPFSSSRAIGAGEPNPVAGRAVVQGVSSPPVQYRTFVEAVS